MAMKGGKYRGCMTVKDDGVPMPTITTIKDISVAQPGATQSAPKMKDTGVGDLSKVPMVKDVGVPKSKRVHIADTGVPNPRGS